MCQYITDTAMRMSANLFKLQAKSEFEFLADKSDKVSKLISGTWPSLQTSTKTSPPVKYSFLSKFQSNLSEENRIRHVIFFLKSFLNFPAIFFVLFFPERQHS